MDDYAGIKKHVFKEFLVISASIYYKLNLGGRGRKRKEKENSKLYT